MPDDVELCAIMLPGRERRLREPAHRDFPGLAADLARAVAPLTDRPYILFGHSMGALLAYEFARYASRELANPPERLVVSARGAPSRIEPDEDLLHFDDKDIVRWMRRIGGTPAEVFDNPELLNIVVATLRADLAVCASYRYEPEPILTCDVTAVGGRVDRSVTKSDLMPWAATTTGSFDVRMFDGGHFFLFDNAFNATVLRSLVSTLRAGATSDERPKHTPAPGFAGRGRRGGKAATEEGTPSEMGSVVNRDDPSSLTSGRPGTDVRDRVDFADLAVHVEAGAHPSALVVTPTHGGLHLHTVVAHLAGGHLLAVGVGAVTFRGFPMRRLSDFAAIVNRSDGSALDYVYGSTPRRDLGRGIYTASKYAPSERIVLHNEMSYTSPWPRYLWFWCVEPALEGGCTPLAAADEVLRRLPEPMVEEFRRRGVAYVRTFAPGIDVPWQEAFGTSDPNEVAAWCQAAGITYEWPAPNILRTRQVGVATVTHPVTGGECWFNQAHLFHRSRLDGSALADHIDPELRPRDATYGDGGAIPDDVVRTIEETYDACAWRSDWQAGDVLLLDNVLTAHGRDPYAGTRQVLVAMEGALNQHGPATPLRRPR